MNEDQNGREDGVPQKDDDSTVSDDTAEVKHGGRTPEPPETEGSFEDATEGADEVSSEQQSKLIAELAMLNSIEKIQPDDIDEHGMVSEEYRDKVRKKLVEDPAAREKLKSFNEDAEKFVDEVLNEEKTKAAQDEASKRDESDPFSNQEESVKTTLSNTQAEALADPTNPEKIAAFEDAIREVGDLEEKRSMKKKDRKWKALYYLRISAAITLFIIGGLQLATASAFAAATGSRKRRG